MLCTKAESASSKHGMDLLPSYQHCAPWSRAAQPPQWTDVWGQVSLCYQLSCAVYTVDRIPGLNPLEASSVSLPVAMTKNVPGLCQMSSGANHQQYRPTAVGINGALGVHVLPFEYFCILVSLAAFLLSRLPQSTFIVTNIFVRLFTGPPFSWHRPSRTLCPAPADVFSRHAAYV